MLKKKWVSREMTEGLYQHNQVFMYFVVAFNQQFLLTLKSERKKR
jgi:hypothetical protein